MIERPARQMRTVSMATAMRVGRIVKWRVLAPISATLYRLTANHLWWWPIGLAPAPRLAHTRPAGRVAYYLQSFPHLSETFIQREIAALLASGVPITIIAHHRASTEHLDETARLLMAGTRYLDPPDPARSAAYRRQFFRRRPLAMLNLSLYVRFRRLTVRKTRHLDRDLFARAIYVAGVLREEGATHVHTPWAGREAVVALLAARMLRIPYSVQARASDMHRHAAAHGLREKLAHGAVVITNTRYNEAIIRELLGPGADGKVRQIYNGIDLTRFTPGAARNKVDSEIVILSVARLIEAKGLEYLLHACRLLNDEGRRVRCDIIGGRSPLEMNYYIELQKLRRRLGLERDVTFHGPQPFARVLEHYAEADVFVLPSVIARDGSGDVTPNVVIEAMAMELPVVSTPQRGIPELVEHESTGLLVPPRDPPTLARAIARLADDASLRRKFGRNGRKRVEERFDVSKNIREYVALFCHSLPRNGRS
jgi:glycosyltransferase involved in cell wall biosynthesis